jgi:hypothetical protein
MIYFLLFTPFFIIFCILNRYTVRLSAWRGAEKYRYTVNTTERNFLLANQENGQEKQDLPATYVWCTELKSPPSAVLESLVV